MGQKVNPEIFRLTKIDNNWKSKYIESKTNEISTFFFQSLEIKNFIKRFMAFHGLLLHSCKLSLSSTSLHVIIFYYATKRATILINRKHANKNENTCTKLNEKSTKNSSQIIKNIIKKYYKCIKIKNQITNKTKKFSKKVQKVKCYYTKSKFSSNIRLKNFKKKIRFKFRLPKKKTSKKNKKKYANYFNPRRFFSKQFFYLKKTIKKRIKTKRLRSIYIKRIKEHYNLTTYKNKKNVQTNSFTELLLENLLNFTGKKNSVFITLKSLKMSDFKDQYLKKDAIYLKKKLRLKLYRYKKSEFFEIAKRIILITARRKNSAQFLANFISSQLNRLKKEQYFFLKFIKKVFALLLKKKFSTKLYGIKIVVKGRLKKARRAKRRSFKMLIGKVPLQCINSNINHAKATSYTLNGTFGTEIWINYFKTSCKKFFKRNSSKFNKNK